MTKKRVFFIVFILLISISFIAAQNETIDTAEEKVNNAYACLTEKTVGKCSSLSIEEKIFSVLAIGECEDELMADSRSIGECWPDSPTCNLKNTAQAILALDKTVKDTTDAENWLISRNTSPSDVVWYLQIDSKEETTCTLTYSGVDYKVVLDEDKKLNRGAGNCLSLSSDDWWLEVNPGCFELEFEISCDKDFQTNLIFKRKTSDVFYISSLTNPSSANGKTTEKVKSSCFRGSDGKCDYEGSLWAAFALFSKGYNVDDYLPYLITMEDENARYLPEAFLYLLTARENYKTDLKLRQKAGKYWDEGDKFYDTSLALLAITEDSIEKSNTIEWLFEIQLNDGCFPTNIKNNAFLLASIWPRQVDPSLSDCEDAGYYCGIEAACEGNVLASYTCTGISAVCCDTFPTPKTCAEQNGEICSSDENCVGGTQVSATDTDIGQICCVGGECKVPEPLSECEENSGICSISCISGEVEADYDCPFSEDVCCVKGEEPSYWWIWLLVILIILVILGIIFRKRIRTIIIKEKRYPKRPGPPGPGPRPGMPPLVRPMQRRILPPSSLKTVKPKPKSKAKKPDELSDVLKKLKEISK